MVDNGNAQKSHSIQTVVVFTLRFTYKADVIFTIHVSSLSMQQIVYSAYLEKNLCRTYYPWLMHYECQIECVEVESVYTDTWVAYLRFHDVHFRRYRLVAQVAFGADVAFRAVVPPVLVHVRWFLCSWNMSVDSLLYHFGMEGSRPCAIYKPLPVVFLSQPLPSSTQDTQLVTSSLFRLRHEVG